MYKSYRNVFFILVTLLFANFSFAEVMPFNSADFSYENCEEQKLFAEVILQEEVAIEERLFIATGENTRAYKIQVIPNYRNAFGAWFDGAYEVGWQNIKTS